MKSRSTFYQVRKAVIFSVNRDFQPNYERARHIQPCHTPCIGADRKWYSGKRCTGGVSVAFNIFTFAYFLLDIFKH